MKNAKHKVAYAAGPGDVISSYRHWLSGQSDPNEVSETYSSQFYECIKELDLTAVVYASHPRAELMVDDRFTIEHRPQNLQGRKGFAYHLSDVYYWLGILLSIKRSNCSIAIISNMEHWWLLFLLKIAGVRVVPSLHCAFWPKGFRPKDLKSRIIQFLNGLFWRSFPMATICISPECARQVKALSGNQFAGSILHARPKYKPELFSNITQPAWGCNPFRLMFAGRIETNKGVFDVLEVVKKLTTCYGLNVLLDVCGAGSALPEMKKQIAEDGLESCIQMHGKLNRKAMFEILQKSHVVVVPTTSNFAEGLNKVVVEGVLANRPVIATSVTPSAEIFPKSVIEVEPGDIDQMVVAIADLVTNKAYYDEVCSHCEEEGLDFYDESRSWGFAVKRSIVFATE